jgi:hypothetical protein
MRLRRSDKILITIVFFVVITTNWLPQIDSITQQFLSDSISSNAIIFGVVRTLNGVISVIQSADIGIGVASVSIGEILDPVNDLVERFSGLLLMTLTALGIQQVLLLLTLSLPIKIVFSIMAFVCIQSLWLKPKWWPVLFKWTVLIVFIRFILVIQVGVVWLFDWLYFDATGQEALSVLEATIRVVETLRDAITNINLSELIFGSNKPVIGNEDLGAKISSSVVTLIVGMLFKSMIIPMATLWIGYKAVSSTFIRSQYHEHRT